MLKFLNLPVTIFIRFYLVFDCVEKTEQEVHEEMFHTNAYPLDKDANKGLCTVIKGLSAVIMGIEGFISFQLIKHIYEYVT